MAQRADANPNSVCSMCVDFRFKFGSDLHPHEHIVRRLLTMSFDLDPYTNTLYYADISC